METVLANLLLQFSAQIESLADRLRRGELSPYTWEEEFLKLLAYYLILSASEGLAVDTLPMEWNEYLADELKRQSVFLHRFTQEIVQTGWDDKYFDRAKLYAESIREPYWRAETECLNLPIVPGDARLDCGQFCKCHLRIVWLNRSECSADVYWVTTKVEVSPDCQELEKLWNPLRVRKGIPQ